MSEWGLQALPATAQSTLLVRVTLLIQWPRCCPPRWLGIVKQASSEQNSHRCVM